MEPSAARLHRTLWVVWVGLLVGPLLFFVVCAALVVALHPGGMVEGGDPRVPKVAGIGTLVLLGTAFLLPNLLCARPRSERFEAAVAALRERREDEASWRTVAAALVEAFLQRSFVAWACGEAAALAAGVTTLLWGFQPLPIAALVLFAVLMLVLAPSRDRVVAALDGALADLCLAHDRVESLLVEGDPGAGG